VAKQFCLYVDESGSASLNPKDDYPYFSMGGILIESDDKDEIKEAVQTFKRDWGFEHPLHGAEIRSKKRSFAWLAQLEDAEYQRFMCELEAMLLSLPIVVHACAIRACSGRLNGTLEAACG
jgi:hypothetical protein